jgi:hypothetical protein
MPAIGVSSEPCLTAIKELVPGDSGGNTVFSEVYIRGGITGSGGEMIER